MFEDQLICDGCLHRVSEYEPERKKRRLAQLAQNLMLFFAIFLFTKGWWMVFGAESYTRFAESMGFLQSSITAHYLGSAFATVSSILYSSAWMAGNLSLTWRARVCGYALAVFGIGQITTQILKLQADDPIPKAIAIMIVWLALPIFQFISLILGGTYNPRPAGDSDGEPGGGETG